MNENDEIPQAIEIMRAVIEELEWKALAGDNPEEALKTIKEVVFVAASHGKASPRRGAPFRGLGYDFDDAQIVASLDEHNGSLEKAVRAHWQREDGEWLDEEQIETIMKRIRRHKRDIEAEGHPDHVAPPPDINSRN